MIKQLCFTLKLFVRIFLFSLFGYMLACGLELSSISGYRLIIGFGIVGSIISICEVIRKMNV